MYCRAEYVEIQKVLPRSQVRDIPVGQHDNSKAV